MSVLVFAVAGHVHLTAYPKSSFPPSPVDTLCGGGQTP